MAARNKVSGLAYVAIVLSLIYAMSMLSASYMVREGSGAIYTEEESIASLVLRRQETKRKHMSSAAIQARGTQQSLIEGLTPEILREAAAGGGDVAAIFATVRTLTRQRRSTDAETKKKNHDCSGGYFATSDRPDLSEFWSTEAEALGLCRYKDVQAPKATLDLYIGEQLEAESGTHDFWVHHSSLGTHTKRRSILLGLDSIFGNKAATGSMFLHCRDLRGAEKVAYSLCPRGLLPSFNVNGDETEKNRKFKYALIFKDNVPHLHNLWRELQRRLIPADDANYIMDTSEDQKKEEQSQRQHQHEAGKDHTWWWWIVRPQRRTSYHSKAHLTAMKNPLESTTSMWELTKWIQSSFLPQHCYRQKTHRTKSDATDCRERVVVYQSVVTNPAFWIDDERRLRRFCVRVWLVVTSIDPLRIFLLRHGIPRIVVTAADSTDRAYSLPTLGRCAHVGIIPDPTCDYDNDFFASYPPTTSFSRFRQRISFGKNKIGQSANNARSKMTDRQKQDQSAAESDAVWTSHVWPEIEKQLTQLIMLNRPRLMEEIAANPTHGLPGTVGTFFILAPDIQVDAHGDIYFEDFNLDAPFPGVISSSPDDSGEDIFFDMEYVKSALHLLGVSAFPQSRAYANRLHKTIDTYFKENSILSRTYNLSTCLNDDDRKSTKSISRLCRQIRTQLMNSIHEEAHAGSHWYRIYPPIPCFEHRAHCQPYNDGGPDTVLSWPDQGRLTYKQSRAFNETLLDVISRDFLSRYETELIHGVPQLPGHGRWP